jgi:hypothetical protein
MRMATSMPMLMATPMLMLMATPTLMLTATPTLMATLTLMRISKTTPTCRRSRPFPVFLRF